jgi:hypothetical protein
MNVTQQRSAWVRASGLFRHVLSGLRFAALHPRSAALRAAVALARAARHVARVLAECHRAQRQIAMLRIQPDRYALNGDRPPETYAEFLFRCPATVWHEPSARERADSGSR